MTHRAYHYHHSNEGKEDYAVPSAKAFGENKYDHRQHDTEDPGYQGHLAHYAHPLL